MPNPKRIVSIGVLMHSSASPTLALLVRDVFRAANDLLGYRLYDVRFFSVKKRVFRFGDVAITVEGGSRRHDIVFVAPFSHEGLGLPEEWEEECEMIRGRHERGGRIASSCLGSLILAKSGILDGKEATTHWGWLEFAKARFPLVQWNSKDIICQSGSVFTSGGYLATVDLALHLISQTTDKKCAHDLGRVLLAESNRQRQSVYATSLIASADDSSPFYRLEEWVDRNLQKEISVGLMASRCHMSLRHFQRQFTARHGIGPKGFLQLKRIERAKELLRDTRLSTEEIVEKVGMSDVSAFRKIFQRELGVTPAEFRRRIK